MSCAKCVAVSGLALGIAGALVGARSAAHAQAKPPRARVQVAASGNADVSTAGASATASAAESADAGAPAADAGAANAAVDFEALDRELPPGDDLPPANLPPPPTAGADQAPKDRRYGRKAALLNHVRLDGHVAFTWDGAFGVGVRADWLLIEGTFKYSTRDELAISAGADITFVSFDGTHVIEAFPTAVLQWSIGVDDRLFFYPEFGFIGHINDGKWDGLYPNVGFGGRYYLARSVGLQARFGWPIAFSAGAVF